MDLNGIIHKNQHFKQNNTLTDKEIQQVRNFVLNNSYALSKVADEDIYMDDFDSVMIKGGEISSEEDRGYQIESVNNIIQIRLNAYASTNDYNRYRS